MKAGLAGVYGIELDHLVGIIIDIELELDRSLVAADPVVKHYAVDSACVRHLADYY